MIWKLIWSASEVIPGRQTPSSRKIMILGKKKRGKKLDYNKFHEANHVVLLGFIKTTNHGPTDPPTT